MAFAPPRLGPGAIYLRSLDGLFRSHADLIKVAEIEPQSLWTKGTAPGALPRGSPEELRQLQALPQHILMHGVGCPIGGTICDQVRHVPYFRAWSEALNAPWTSEHLSIFHLHGRSGEEPCGFLMPPLQTEAGAKLAVRNITRRAAALGKPFAFETGVNYFAPRPCEMPDGEFFRTIAEAADCGILLDLTNLWANHKNGRADIHDVLACLPLERVWEVHLAGLEFAHGHWLDAHSNAVDDELVEIASDVVANLPNLGAIIFEIAPDRVDRFGERNWLTEMEKVQRLWDKSGGTVRCEASNNEARPRAFAGPVTPSPEDWERTLAKGMLQSQGQSPANAELLELRGSDERSFSLYRELIASFRRGAIAELMANTTRLLLLAMGETALRHLMDRYVAVCSPMVFPTDEALSFRRFLAQKAIPIPGLEDLSKFEATLVAAAADGGPLQVELSIDIDAVLGDITMGRLPGPSTLRPGTVLEIAVDPVPVVRMIQ
jgi:uncharacterized protein (UPF0276 family)